MSAGGSRQMVINTQERAVSTDVNRLQKFAAKDRAEFFRYLLDAYGSDDLDAGGVLTEPSTVETPLRAEIIGGLLARPQSASTNVTVDPGLAMVMSPDATADESDYKYVRDTGTASPLTIAANSSGSARVDVVECRINADEEIVDDSRDIFNEATGLFAATVVTKEAAARLEYRVRQGTPGSGFPANVSGWLPLCVAYVPDGSTSNDAVTFWDVRPLVNDRAAGLSSLTRDLPVHLGGIAAASATAGRQVGELEVVDASGRRLGGRLRGTSPGSAAADYLDWRDGHNWDTGIYPNNNSVVFAYLATPFGLPRWARYAASPSARVPQSPRGLLLLSNTGPTVKGAPSSALALTGPGLGGTTSAAVCVMCSKGSGGNTHVPGLGGRIHAVGTAPGTLASVSGTLGAGQSDFVLVPNTSFPKNAKQCLVEITLVFTIPNGSGFDINGGAARWYVAGNSANPSTWALLPGANTGYNSSGGDLTFYYQVEVWLNVPSEWPGDFTTPMLLSAFWSSTGGAFTPTGATASVRAWEF